MDIDLPARLLAEAQRCAPAAVKRSRLVPFREAVLTFLARRISHDQIAVILRQHGVPIARSAIGDFCRRYCPAVDIERVRRELVSAATGAPALAATAAAPAPSPDASLGKRRNPRIARDDL